MVNEKVIAGLNPANKVEGIYAYLVDELDKEVFSFLYNPEEKDFTRQAKYDEGVTALTSLPSQHYRYTKGKTLQLSNLILESYSNGKTCQLLLDRLQALMEADPLKGNYAPTPVYFRWGADTFGPAVLTDLSWKETSWLNGKVATARVDITLLEIPPSQLPSKALAQTSQDKLQAALNQPNNLTDRQKVDAASQADVWLRNNIKSLPENVANLIKAKKCNLQTADNGDVNLYDNKSNLLGFVGNYKDGKLNVTNNTLIKLFVVGS